LGQHNLRVDVKYIAERDLLEALEFLREESPNAALRFVDAVEKTLGDLSKMPGIGSMYEFSNPRLQGLRRCRINDFEKYLFFYRVEYDAVVIHRVIYGVRNIPSVFDEEP